MKKPSMDIIDGFFVCGGRIDRVALSQVRPSSPRR
jgi:hypothetical protein